MDAKSGQLLASWNPNEQQYAASTVKVITALTAVRLRKLTSTITVTPLAAGRPPMRIGMNAGEKWTVEQALISLLMISANDAAYAIAEGTAGTVSAFSREMAKTGKLLGLTDSTFKDPSGLDGNDTPIGASKMSAYDLALAGQALLRDPRLAKIVDQVQYNFTDPAGQTHTLVNHNRALSPNQTKYYDGMVGIKTGFTNLAQGTFLTAATRHGTTLIAVVLGTKDIYTAARILLDYGFAISKGAGAPTKPSKGGGVAGVAGATDSPDPEQLAAEAAALQNPALLATTTLPSATTALTVSPALTQVTVAPSSNRSTIITAVLSGVGVAAMAGLIVFRTSRGRRERRHHRNRALHRLSTLFG